MIFFTGPDVSGKNSLMHEVAKNYNYRYFMSPRSPICNIVYDKLYRKTTHQENYSLIKDFLNLNAYFVLIKVEPRILEQRALARNEQHVKTIDDFKKHIKVFKEVFDDCKKRFGEGHFIEVDNSGTLSLTAFTLGDILNNKDKMAKFYSTKG